MLQPSMRFATVLLAVGAAVLVVAIAFGEHVGDRALSQSVEHRLTGAEVAITPEPDQTSGPFGPDWKRSETLSAAPDPRFPDPRVPPQPLPTRPPVVAPPPPPLATPTPNSNIPIWRQVPIPSESPSAQPSAGAPAPSSTPSAAPPAGPVQPSPSSGP